jgi:hypothetical protein
VDLAALDILIPVVQRGVAEDIVLLFLKIRRKIDVTRGCRPLDPDRRRPEVPIAIPIPIAGGKVRLAIDSIAVGRERIVVAVSLA